MGLNAQESTTYDYNMKYKSDDYGGTWLATGLSEEDSLGIGDSTWTYTVRKLSREKVLTTFRVVLDSVGGTAVADVTINFKYKPWLKAPWVTDSTVTYTGTVDTTMQIVLDAAVVADYWQIDISCATDEFNVLIDSVYFKMIY